MSAQYTIVADACVLYSAPVRDLLLELAVKDIFQARWSEKILDEMKHSILKNRPDISPEAMEKLILNMNKHTRDCLVEENIPLIEAIEGLKDQNDRHVVATALQCRAHMIVTWNLKDFPIKALQKYRLEISDPDKFLLAQYDLAPGVFIHAIQTIRKRLKRKPKSADEYLDTIARAGLPRTAAKLRPMTIAF